MVSHAVFHGHSMRVHPIVYSLDTDRMLLIVIAVLGGVLAILSLCILPLVPWVFARADASFATGRRPLLLGLAASFALVIGLGIALHGAIWRTGAALATYAVDARVPAHIPGAATAGVENKLVGLPASDAPVRKVRQPIGLMQPGQIIRVSTSAAHSSALPVEGRLPSFDGATTWLNSPPLSSDALRGKVVVVNFWTYSCINCLRTLPYLKTWAQRYGNDGLVVIGVHTPEFAFEHDTGNVKRALTDLNIHYPVAIDNNYGVWRAFDNQYWPAFYIVDAQGRIRYHHFGEGNYHEAEQVIQQLLADNGGPMPDGGPQPVHGAGSQAAADPQDVRSGETYVGYREAQGFASPQGVLQDSAAAYTLPAQLSLNDWALAGQWNIGAESAEPTAPASRIAFRFHARDLHLVMAPAADGKPVRFRITVDGAPPGDAHGADVASDGTGTVTSARLYQLVRQRGPVNDRTFEIQFLDPGAHVFSFTFG